MHWKLRGQQLKIILYIYRLLYQNLMGTTNQKSTVHTHTQKEKAIQTNTKDRHYKKRKLQTNITDEYRCKNPQQNTSKQNPTTH